MMLEVCQNNSITHIRDFGCETQRDFIAVEKVPDFSEGPAARMLGGTVGIFFKLRGWRCNSRFRCNKADFMAGQPRALIVEGEWLVAEDYSSTLRAARYARGSAGI